MSDHPVLDGIAQRVEAEWDHLTAKLRNQAPESSAPATQENHMTTPQQPQRLVDSLHAITAEFANNKMIARLADHRLGSTLSDEQADNFCALIQSVERGGQVYVAPMHDSTQQQHDGAQQ